MNRRFFGRAAGLLLAAAGVSAAAAKAETRRAHQIVFHVGAAEPGVMKIALHNIENAAQYYAARNETVAIELVANGPGYTMLRADTSPVKSLIEEVQRRYPFVVFTACQNSRKGIAEAEGKAPQDIPELPGVTDVPAGVVRLAELQEQGWSYIRP